MHRLPSRYLNLVKAKRDRCFNHRRIHGQETRQHARGEQYTDTHWRGYGTKFTPMDEIQYQQFDLIWQFLINGVLLANEAKFVQYLAIFAHYLILHLSHLETWQSMQRGEVDGSCSASCVFVHGQQISTQCQYESCIVCACFLFFPNWSCAPVIAKQAVYGWSMGNIIVPSCTHGGIEWGIENANEETEIRHTLCDSDNPRDVPSDGKFELGYFSDACASVALSLRLPLLRYSHASCRDPEIGQNVCSWPLSEKW